MFHLKKTNSTILLRKDIISLNFIDILLENINITKNKNTFLFLKGLNGTGKTSLLNYMTNKIKLKSKYNNILSILIYFSYINNIYNNLYKHSYNSHIKNKIKNCSFGFKQFFCVISNYKIKKLFYIFDEPFNGLDKIHIKKIQTIIIKLRIINTIIFKSSHFNIKYNNFVTLFLN